MRELLPNSPSDLVLGFSNWNKFEKTAWQLGLSASAIWMLYILVFEIFFFQPEPYEQYESTVVVQNHSTFNDFMMNAGRPPSAGTIAQIEGRQSRNVERQQRNIERQRRNDSYISRGLIKAVTYPLAWMTALLTLITVFERLQAADRSRGETTRESKD